MKIAVYYNLLFGGAKRVVQDQVKGLTLLGNTVDVYVINHEVDAFDPKPYAKHNYNYNFPTPFVDFPIIGRLIHLYNSLYRLRRLQKRIAKDIDKRKYDVVLVHPDRYVQAPFVLSFLKTKTIYYCQEPYRIAYEYSMRIGNNVSSFKKIFENAFRYLVKTIDRENVRKASFTIASCNYVRERMIESYDVYPYVISPGINISLFKPTQKKKNDILFLGGKIDKLDGFDLLDRAIKLLPKNKRLKIKFVEWKKDNNERLTEKELVDIYSGSFLTLCMTRLETFGLTPLESMASGTPVIATNVSGHRETITDNMTGLLVDHDPEDIARAILTMQSNRNLYTKIQKNGLKNVRKNWSIDKKNKELDAFIRKILKK